jgi:hypothetical protein
MMRVSDAHPLLTSSSATFKQSTESKPRFSSRLDRRAASDNGIYRSFWL